MPIWNYGLLKKISQPFDKLLEIRDRAAAPVTTSGSTPAVAFTFAGFLAKQFGYKLIINHAAYANYSPTVYWNISVDVSADGTNFIPVGSVRLNGSSANTTMISLHGGQIENVVPNASFIRIGYAAVGATPGSLAFGAYLAPAEVM